MKREHYYAKSAAAYVRGAAAQSKLMLRTPLVEMALDELDEAEIEEILESGMEVGIKLHRFKRTHEGLPRVKRVLGFLKSIGMDSLLDVGSGRGAFLWPCLDAFPALRTLSVDILKHRVDMLNTVRSGGMANLQAVLGDICTLAVADGAYDVVSMLEVLEHIPDAQAAVRAAVRIARRHVVVSVPSKPDNNPEHIHLLTKPILTALFQQAGCDRLHFDGVPGHMILVAALEG